MTREPRGTDDGGPARGRPDDGATDARRTDGGGTGGGRTDDGTTDAGRTDGGATAGTRAGGEVAGLVLAAGGGRRLGGRAKALLAHRGRPLVEHAAGALRAAGCARVHVVLGARADEVRRRARLDGCVLVDNPDWERGMGSSLRAGLASLTGTGARAALVCLVDQPGIGAEAVARVLGAYRDEASLVTAAYAGVRGHPVLLGALHWEGVAAAATGDRGARAYLREHEEEIVRVECADVARAYDIDTEDDLRHLSAPRPDPSAPGPDLSAPRPNPSAPGPSGATER